MSLAVTGSGARKVETALVELNACRGESNIETQQITNCQARAEAAEAEVKHLNSSVDNLNQAVAKLNATGQRSADLLPYAAESIRRARRLDAVAEELRKRLP